MKYQQHERAAKGSLFFVEAPLTGSGCMHLQWAFDHGFDVWMITANPAKYADVACGSIVATLQELGRVYLAQCPEGRELPADLIALTQAIGAKAGVVCVSDRNLVFAASLAQALGASFISVAGIECLRDKRAARALFDQLQLPTARWCAPSTEADVVDFAKSVPSGVVIKNCRGTGSLDVRFSIGAESTWQTFQQMQAATRYLDGDLMLEEYLYGPLVSLEALVIQGQALTIGVTDRQLGPLPDFCEVSYTFPISLPEADVAVMKNTVNKLVEHLHIEQGFLHVEFIITADGPKLVEVNPRLGGGLLARMMDDCLTRPISELLCMSAFNAISTVPALNGKASSTTTVYPSKRGRLVALDGLQRVAASPFVQEVVSVAKIGAELAPAKDYRGSVCQIRTTAGSANLAFNSAQTAAQLVAIELAE